jgi:hypothetical protein
MYSLGRSFLHPMGVDTGKFYQLQRKKARKEILLGVSKIFVFNFLFNNTAII